MKVERVSVDELTLDERNARAHPEKNLRVIEQSLAKFGQQKPIVVNADSVVLAGNGLLLAARNLGWKTVQVVRTNLEDGLARAYALADNRAGELSEWDWESLARELDALKGNGLDLAEIGWDAHEADLVMAAEFTVQATDAAAAGAGDEGRLVVAFTPAQAAEVRGHLARQGVESAAEGILKALRAWA